MGKGDLSGRVPGKGSGELRELAENYNTMAAQLESLDKTRNQFVSNASHELKTPLATMKILLESMIYQPDMPAEVREDFMKDMNHEIDRLTGIVTDLLVLTRMDNSEDMKRDTVNMSELTQETIRLLTPAAEQHQQTLTEDVQEDLFLYGDRSKLSQILYNLMDNAIKYTPAGGSVTMCMEGPADFGAYNCHIFISDTGVGMDKSFLPKLFEPFSQERTSITRKIEGTGLGMSIVKSLVDLMGGKITVDSERGKGTRFDMWFFLPPGQTSEAAEVPVDGELMQLVNRRILLCEDNEINRELM
jgi:signal transduction histidine kinase